MTTEEIIALHETAHFAVAGALGVNALPVVFDENQQFPQSNGVTVAGECRLEIGASLSDFQRATIGWSGIVLEGLLGIKHSLSLPWPLTKATMRDWHRTAMADFETLSIGDQRLISGYKRSSWTTFKAAFRIVRKNKSRIVRLAKLLVENRGAPWLASPWQPPQPTAAESEQRSIKARAAFLEKFLAGIPADSPDRPKLEKALEYLRRGENPPESLFTPPTAPEPK
jgi:hypothetical protein